MPAIFEAESTLTDRYQTTVPENVRRTLALGKRDQLRYTVRDDGQVVLTRATPAEQDDPLMGSFLGFLALDLAQHPENAQTIDAALADRLRALTSGVSIDLDAPLSAQDE